MINSGSGAPLLLERVHAGHAGPSVYYFDYTVRCMHLIEYNMLWIGSASISYYLLCIHIYYIYRIHYIIYYGCA